MAKHMEVCTAKTTSIRDREKRSPPFTEKKGKQWMQCYGGKTAELARKLVGLGDPTKLKGEN